MESRGIDKIDELPVADTPEDVAVLYSWANLHGAKYRDFSASRREYRAQLRHRAAEQVREQELKAQAEAEAAAAAADAAARQAKSAAMAPESVQAESSRQQALREAGRAARIASAERVEAARRAEAAAVAEAEARRAEREIAEATASARLQASRYTDSEMRRRESGVDLSFTVPGEISDPYVPHPHLQSQPLPSERVYERPATQRGGMRPLVSGMETPTAARFETVSQAASHPVERRQEAAVPYATAPRQIFSSEAPPAVPPSGQRRRQGYTPDDASGVRQIYRGPEFDESQDEYVAAEPTQHSVPARIAASAEPSQATRNNPVDPYGAARAVGAIPAEMIRPEASISAAPSQVPGWPFTTGERVEDFDARFAPRTGMSQIAVPSSYTGQAQGQRGGDVPRIAAPASPRGGYPYAKTSGGDSGRGRRAQDDLGISRRLTLNRHAGLLRRRRRAHRAEHSEYLMRRIPGRRHGSMRRRLLRRRAGRRKISGTA